MLSAPASPAMWSPPAPPSSDVVTASTVQLVGPGPAADRVVPAATEDHVPAGATEDDVVARSAYEQLGTTVVNDRRDLAQALRCRATDAQRGAVTGGRGCTHEGNHKRP